MDLVPRLQQLGILEVWVRHRDLEFLEERIDEGLGECQREVYASVRKNFESVMNGAASQLDISDFQNSIGELFGFLSQSSSSNVLLQKLDAFDNYLMSHSTNVSYLSLLLGMKLERYVELQTIVGGDMPNEYRVWFVVGVQSFQVGGELDTLVEAEWWRDQFLTALRVMVGEPKPSRHGVVSGSP